MLTDAQRRQEQESIQRIAEAAQRAHNVNLINGSNRRANATTEQLMSGDFTPKPEPAPREGAKIIAYVILKKCRAAMSDGCWSFEAGRVIDDLSVARELMQAEIPMAPIYAPEDK